MQAIHEHTETKKRKMLKTNNTSRKKDEIPTHEIQFTRSIKNKIVD